MTSPSESIVRLPEDKLPFTVTFSPFRANSREPLVTLRGSSDVPIVTSPPSAMYVTSSSRWRSPSIVTDFAVMLPAEKTPHSVSSSWSAPRSPFSVTPYRNSLLGSSCIAAIVPW